MKIFNDKKMTKIYFLWTCIFFMCNVYAYTQQSNETSEVKDEKAKELLDKLSANNKPSIKPIKVSFSFNLENKDQKINETQKGTLILKGNKFKVDMEKITVVSDAKTRWTFLKSAKEVQIDNATSSDEEELIEPSKIFTMHEKGFKYKYVGTEKINSTDYHVVKLFPENVNKKSYHTILLYIDKIKNDLYQAKILAKDGNKYTYTLSNKTTVEANDSEFVFDIKQADEVVDLR